MIVLNESTGLYIRANTCQIPEDKQSRRQFLSWVKLTIKEQELIRRRQDMKISMSVCDRLI
jgi:hypothetical protein